MLITINYVVFLQNQIVRHICRDRELLCPAADSVAFNGWYKTGFFF